MISLRGARARLAARGRGRPRRARSRAPRAPRVRGRAEGEARPRAPRCRSHRHYDVTREADLIEEVGRLHGLRHACRGACPPARDRVGAPEPRAACCAAAPRTSSRDLGFDEIVAWALRRAGARRPPAACRPTTRAGARSPPPTRSPRSSRAMRTTLLGGLLDAARHNLARGAERVALFESGRAYLAERRPGARVDRSPGELRRAGWRPRRASRTGSPPGDRGRCARRRGRRRPRPRRGFFELKGVLEALGGPARRRARARGRRAEPFLHPGRAAADRGSAARPPAGSASCTRWSRREWDLPGGARLRGRPRRRWSPRRPAETEALRGRHHLPGRAPGPRRGRRRRRPGRAGPRGGARGRAASCCARPQVFDLYHGEQVGEGRKSLALRLEFRAPDRTLTDEEVAERARGDPGRARRDRGIAA